MTNAVSKRPVFQERLRVGS